ncbi:hypothetical protein V6N13_132714 [Hibiscus sabdariffa]|uniref:PGG domain-containing protein n=1 Tax=Hibiscus sabdariffa TaxID=183260 RepID=A0ABR2PWM9_9ROSI
MQDLERSVYEAAISGNVAAMDALLQEDELILDRVSLTCFHETLLHIAIMRGHLYFAASLISRRPRFSGEFDSLHLAAIEGHAELVTQLLDVNPSCCSVRDHGGRTPLHLAAMKGRVGVMNVLIRRCPESIEEKLCRGETSLHLCVRFNQLEALTLLVEASSEWNAAFVTVQDDAGNTILHLATFLKHLEIVRYLVSLPRIRTEINGVNRMRVTVLDLLEHFPKDFKSLEIENILMKAVANRVEGPSNEIVGARTQRLLPNVDRMKSEAKAMKSSWFVRLHEACNKCLKHQGNWIKEMQGSLMLVATLTATISFQVAFSPPGGVWQQHYHKEMEPVCRLSQDGVCQPGTSVLAYVYPKDYFFLVVFATVSFFASISIVMLGISGLPLKNKVSTWLMTVAMIIAITFTTLTYLYSMVLVTPDYMLSQANKAYNDTFYSWLSLLGIVALFATLRLLLWLGRVRRPKFMSMSRTEPPTLANYNIPN